MRRSRLRATTALRANAASPRRNVGDLICLPPNPDPTPPLPRATRAGCRRCSKSARRSRARSISRRRCSACCGTLIRHHSVVRGMVTLLRDGELHVEAVEGFEDRARTIRIKLGEGITGKVVESGKPIVVPRVSREPAFLNLAPRRPENPKQELSFICVPITLNRAGGRRARRRSALQGRARLRQQREVLRHRQLDDRAGAQRAAHGRGGAAAAARREHAPAAGAARALRLLEHHRHQRADAADVRAGGAGRADQHHRADPRRVGHRQGADRARHPLQLAAREEAVRQGELRGAARHADRVGAVRLREGRVHRRQRPQEGPLRDGRGRHAVPRRDRRHQPRARR